MSDLKDLVFIVLISNFLINIYLDVTRFLLPSIIIVGAIHLLSIIFSFIKALQEEEFVFPIINLVLTIIIIVIPLVIPSVFNFFFETLLIPLTFQNKIFLALVFVYIVEKLIGGFANAIPEAVSYFSEED